MKMIKLRKLKKGDKVAVLSPSFAAPGLFSDVYELGLKRLRDVFSLEPVEYPTTRQVGATHEERARDLSAAFENKDIKAVIASIGGDDQVTYIKNLPVEVFIKNPKPFLGYSDNTHFMNFLWQNGIPSYYGGSIMTQFAMQGGMDEYSVAYIKKALFEEGEFELFPSNDFTEIGLEWSNLDNLNKRREYVPNDGWFWDSSHDAEGVTWGGCLESLDEMLRHGISIPSIEDFKDVVLLVETSEEIPASEYVMRVFRAFGERGILENVKAILVGRPKAWEFGKENEKEQRDVYRVKQRETIVGVVRNYNKDIPIVQNLDFGHTDPQVPMPYGMKLRIDGLERRIFVRF